MLPSPEWDLLLTPFESCFTRPGFRFFRAFVLAFAGLDGRLHVTQVVLSGLLSRHFTSFYRFLGQGAWKIGEVTATLWERCWPVCLTAEKRLFVAADDTVCRHEGKRFFGIGTHHDPMNRDHPRRLSRGHCFVCLAALAQQGAAHVVALFLSCALYVQEKSCPEEHPFQTKLELAVGLFRALSVPVGATLYAVVDGAYAKREFVFPLIQAGRQVISRLRKDAVFYDLPPVRRKRQKGARRKYGRKWKATEWAQPAKGWREVTLRLYGREVTLSLKTRVVLLRRLKVQARLVAVRWGDRPLVFLFSTDRKLSPEEIVRAYCARFAIETGFRDAKQWFALSTYQVRKLTSILRIVHLCLWTQTLLRLRYWSVKVPTAVFGEWRKPVDYLTLGQMKRLARDPFRLFGDSGGGHGVAPIGASEKVAA